LAESNLFLISAGGPGSLSFNEFNPIFNRNGAAFQFSTLAGEDDTIGGEIVLSAIQNKLSWSLGGTKFQTDGWRDNADQDDTIATAFMQYELTYKTSIQAEYRYRDRETGDLQQRFFEDAFFSTLRNEGDRQYFRLGGRHSWSPSNITLVNLSYQNADDSTTLGPANLAFPVIDFEAEFPDQDAYSAEAQHLFRSQYLDVVGGGGYFDIDSKFYTTVTLDPLIVPPPFNVAVSTQDQDLQHYNVYAYTYIKPLESLALTVGASGDFVRADDDESFVDDKDRFNPKFGIVWNPIPSTTLRGAAFSTLKRTLITDQTLEPTQVAGFNQFFDEENATETWRYGLAWDQKLPKNIYVGLEGSYRDIEIPYVIDTTGFGDFEHREENADEYEALAYFFWTPHEWLGLRVEGRYEELESEGDTDLPKRVETYSVPLGVNFFHPIGLSAGVTTTYYDQDGKFVNATGAFEKDDETFWLVNAAVKYRFPKRYGFFTIGVTNLLDEDFEYYERDRENTAIQPDRFYFASITLAVP
jgi:predicted porin